MNATKSFRIGEYALGGIIQVQITGKLIMINALDWNTKKVITSGSAMLNEYDSLRKIDNYLNDLTSSYYADKILNWIKSKINVN